MQAWILIGMMGAGKSTIGKILADKSNRKFVDTDKLVEQRLGRPISQIFKLYGEQAFRDHETAIIRDLTSEPAIIATGGGAVQRSENWEHLQAIGITIYLRSQPAELIRRLQASKKKRPLLSTEDWEAKLVSILSDRTSRYESAQIVVDVDNMDQEDVVEKILKEVGS